MSLKVTKLVLTLEILNRELRDKCRELENLKRRLEALKKEQEEVMNHRKKRKNRRGYLMRKLRREGPVLF
jgi:proteasome assembly chaperone (PAC2) family protein